MPRARKPAGSAVDRRNGARVALPVVRLARFALPGRSDGQVYDLRTRRMWGALWADARLVSVLSPVDRELLVRWAEAVDEWVKAMARAREAPLGTGSTGQDVASPWWRVAEGALGVAERCEAQIGVGALNRARLGIAVLAEARLADLSAGFPGDGDGSGLDDDPRLG